MEYMQQSICQKHGQVILLLILPFRLSEYVPFQLTNLKEP